MFWQQKLLERNFNRYPRLSKLVLMTGNYASFYGSCRLREPVDGHKYYNIIKDPMDLRMVETKTTKRSHQ
jgi:hypothetical protein